MYRITLFICASFLPFLHANAQSAEKVTNNYIKFIGGEKNWKKIKTLTTSGEYDYGGISFPFKTYAVAPNRYKFKVESDGKYYAQGFDGAKGWKIDAFKGETTPTIINGAEATSMANESSVELMDLVVRSKVNGVMMTYTGTDSVKSHFCHRIELKQNGATDTLYFDARTYELVLRKTLSKNAELNKTPMNIYYSEYRDIGGVKIPFKTVCESGEQVILTITIDKAILDVPIEEKEFQP
ncbi:MAG TPA: hypothetical protein VK589_03465 [Chryseolinea sp.]|nr:hypothetical protein [Chryseolinea sp.]